MVESNFPNRPFRLRENVWLIRQDINANASLMGWELWIHKNSYSPTYSSGKANRHFKLDGGDVGSVQQNGFDFRGDGPWQILSGQNWIGHNADGTKYVSIEGGAEYDSLGYAQVNSGIQLPNIPRASSTQFLPDVHSGIFGQGFEMRSNRASSSFEHDSDYYWGNQSGRAATRWADAATWNVPLSLLNEIPNYTTAVGTMRLYTYGAYPNNYIGAVDTLFRLTIPSYLQPDYTTVTITEQNAIVTNSGVGAFVQGVSKVGVAISGESSSGYGATIPSNGFWLAFENQSAINSKSATFPNPINSSGQVNVSTSVTDSRGLSKSKSQNITVLPYAPPTINSVKVERALSTGVVDEQAGTYLKVTMLGSVQSLKPSTAEKNTLAYRISTRPKAAAGTTPAAWTLKHNVTVAGTTTLNRTQLVNGPFAITSSHEILIEVVDLFSTSATQQTVGVAKIAQHWDSNRGVGIGKFRENGMLDVLGEIFQSNGTQVEPLGVGHPFFGTTPPPGWMLAQGQEISRTTYAKLFAVIGTSYGAGNGSSTFNLPDLRRRMPVGFQSNDPDFGTMGQKGGHRGIPWHSHWLTPDANGVAYVFAWGDGGNVNIQNAVAQAGSSGQNRLFTQQNSWNQTAGAGDQASTNNLPPYIVSNYIIRVL